MWHNIHIMKRPKGYFRFRIRWYIMLFSIFILPAIVFVVSLIFDQYLVCFFGILLFPINFVFVYLYKAKILKKKVLKILNSPNSITQSAKLFAIYSGMSINKKGQLSAVNYEAVFILSGNI